jgi:hypothetical protein
MARRADRRGKWNKHERRRRETRAGTKQRDALAVLRSRAPEREPPPRLDLKDSRGRPISLPEVTILRRKVDVD